MLQMAKAVITIEDREDGTGADILTTFGDGFDISSPAHNYAAIAIGTMKSASPGGVLHEAFNIAPAPGAPLND
jgi:hypothetical protein